MRQDGNGRTGTVDPAIDPGIVDAVLLIVVTLEIIHEQEGLRGEVPDGPGPGGDRFGVDGRHWDVGGPEVHLAVVDVIEGANDLDVTVHVGQGRRQSLLTALQGKLTLETIDSTGDVGGHDVLLGFGLG